MPPRRPLRHPSGAEAVKAAPPWGRVKANRSSTRIANTEGKGFDRIYDPTYTAYPPL